MRYTRNWLLPALVFPLLIGLSACEKEENNAIDTGGGPPPPTGNNTGRYIHWSRYDMETGGQGNRAVVLVKDGKIFANPYSYSSDGINWTTDPADGLNRQFENFNGEFWAESSDLGGNVKQYQAINGSGSITISNQIHGNMAWEGGSKAYSLANNAGPAGPNVEDDYVVETTDGTNWTPITFQPPHVGEYGSLLDIWLIDGKLYVVGFNTVPGSGFLDYKLYISNGDSWIASSILPKEPKLTKVTGHGIFVTMDGGTYRLVVNGPAISLQNLEFESGTVSSTTISGQLMNANGQLIIGTFGGFYIPHPVTDKFYNPSPTSGVNALPGVGRMVVFGNEIIVSRGSLVYKTPFPFVFHENP